MNRRYILTLDLQENPDLIDEYITHHQNVWPEVKQSLLAAGIVHMEIYWFANRLCMLMEVDETFSFERKSQMDAGNPKVQEWERMMWKYQKSVPRAKSGKKWVLMDKIFEL